MAFAPCLFLTGPLSLAVQIFQQIKWIKLGKNKLIWSSRWKSQTEQKGKRDSGLHAISLQQILGFCKRLKTLLNVYFLGFGPISGKQFHQLKKFQLVNPSIFRVVYWKFLQIVKIYHRLGVQVEVKWIRNLWRGCIKNNMRGIFFAWPRGQGRIGWTQTLRSLLGPTGWWSDHSTSTRCKQVHSETLDQIQCR